jgi:hypothetical protein
MTICFCPKAPAGGLASGGELFKASGQRQRDPSFAFRNLAGIVGKYLAEAEGRTTPDQRSDQRVEQVLAAFKLRYMLGIEVEPR